MNPPGPSFPAASGQRPPPNHFPPLRYPQNEMHKTSTTPNVNITGPGPGRNSNVSQYQHAGYPPNEMHKPVPTPAQLASGQHTISHPNDQMGGMQWSGTADGYGQMQMSQALEGQSQVMNAYGSGSSMGSVNVTLMNQQQQQHQAQPFHSHPPLDSGQYGQSWSYSQQHPQQSRSMTPHPGSMTLAQSSQASQTMISPHMHDRPPQLRDQQQPTHVNPPRGQPRAGISPAMLMAQPRMNGSPSSPFAHLKPPAPHSGDLYTRLAQRIAISNHSVPAHVLFATLLNLGGLIRIQRDELWNQLVALLGMPLVCDPIVLEDYCETGQSKCTTITVEVVVHKYMSELRHQEGDLLRSLMVGYSNTLARMGSNPFAPSSADKASGRPKIGSTNPRRQSETLDPRRSSMHSANSSEPDQGWQADAPPENGTRRSRCSSVRSPLIEKTLMADLMQAARSPSVRRGSKRSSTSADQTESYRAEKVSRTDPVDAVQQQGSSRNSNGAAMPIPAAPHNKTFETMIADNFLPQPRHGSGRALQPGSSFHFGFQDDPAAAIAPYPAALSPTSLPPLQIDTSDAAGAFDTADASAEVPAIAIQPSTSANLGPDERATMLNLNLMMPAALPSLLQVANAGEHQNMYEDHADAPSGLTPEQVKAVEDLLNGMYHAQGLDGVMMTGMENRAQNEAYFDSVEGGDIVDDARA